jgi:uncharacterized membrane protein
MSWRGHLLLFLILVPVFNTLAVLALPSLINHYVMKRMSTQTLTAAAVPATDATARTQQAQVIERGGINIALPSPRPDASARTVVRLSPDLLYSACVFDLAAGPLHITAPVPDSYFSISGFAADTSNFFAYNDRTATTGADGQRRIDLLLSHGTPATVPAGAQVVQAPSRRGVVLFRILIPDEVELPRLQTEFQARQRCEPV